MLTLCHLVDAMGDSNTLWGKERVIHELMHVQRESGTLIPELAVFTPSLLSSVVAADGFSVHVLEERHSALPHKSLPSLMRLVQSRAGLVLHTHSYKANLVARMARLMGAPISILVSTCHGWFDETLREVFYNKLDRATTALSDVTTVCDPRMLEKYPRSRGVIYVPNALSDRPSTLPHERNAARARLGWSTASFVAGILCRLTPLKGAGNFLQAADQCADDIVWAAAGAGPMEEILRSRQDERFRYVGYVNPGTDFLNGIDVFVQASAIEGLSISLLEAMRAGLPIVATRAGATEHVLEHERDGLLVDVCNPKQLRDAVIRLRHDPTLARRLAQNARMRYEAEFQIQTQHASFWQLYTASQLMLRMKFSSAYDPGARR
jgi:glycosyltransferase involved in cell wall biosynthesis